MQYDCEQVSHDQFVLYYRPQFKKFPPRNPEKI